MTEQEYNNIQSIITQLEVFLRLTNANFSVKDLTPESFFEPAPKRVRRYANRNYAFAKLNFIKIVYKDETVQQYIEMLNEALEQISDKIPK